MTKNVLKNMCFMLFDVPRHKHHQSEHIQYFQAGPSPTAEALVHTHDVSHLGTWKKRAFQEVRNHPGHPAAFVKVLLKVFCPRFPQKGQGPIDGPVC